MPATDFFAPLFSESILEEKGSLLIAADQTNGTMSEYYKVVPEGTHFTRKGSLRPSIASLLPKVRNSFRRSKKHKDSHLSAAFNMAAIEFKVYWSIVSSNQFDD